MASEHRILVRRTGEADEAAWVTPETLAYDNEAHLQRILRKDPSQLPGVTGEAQAVDELPTSGGYVDVCIIDVDGSITVVECKLASNSERRRMVIGQVIDYAAAIWMDGEASFLRSWQARDGDDLTEALSPDALATLRENLGEARINLCLAVDAIDDDLRRLIEYLNRVTLEHVRVTALQLAYAKHGDFEILVPSTFGGEIAAAKTRSVDGSSTSWTHQTFFAALATEGDRRLAGQYLARLEATEPLGTWVPVWYGSRPHGGIHLHPHRLRYSPLQLWANKAGRLMVYGNWRQYGVIAAHDGFAHLAQKLGQDHRGGFRGVPADSLDLDDFWPTVVACARVINETSTTEATTPPTTA